MFDKEFFPSPLHVIELLTRDLVIAGKTFWEPQAGSGDIVRYLKDKVAEQVIACEKHDLLRSIIEDECKVIGSDSFKIKSHDISHIDAIVMNPPFSNADRHILHAYSIAPAGCKIRAVCNLNTVKNDHNRMRGELAELIKTFGGYEDIGEAFDNAERKTNVRVALVWLNKPGGNVDSEFEGFFLEEENEGPGASGIMSYNVVRDLVNRYVAAMKLFDQQLDLAVKMNILTEGFFSGSAAMDMSINEVPTSRAEYKKQLQKSGWNWIFDKMNLQKHATKGLKEDINKFVEKQVHIPFTMRNIYHMIDIVIGTTGQRMDKSLLEVFDKLTAYTYENRFNLEGWKTNSHYLVNRRFIMPYLASTGWSGQLEMEDYRSGGNYETLLDFVKALCYITGQDFSDIIELRNFVRCKYKLRNKRTGKFLTGYDNFDSDLERVKRRKDSLSNGIDLEIVETPVSWGQWFEWSFFKMKAYKKGTVHIEFLSADVWAKFNQHIARIKGYSLPEHQEQTKWQKRQAAKNAA